MKRIKLRYNVILIITSLVFSLHINSQTYPSGLMCYWQMDEATGPVYIDYFNTHNASASVSPVVTAGIIDEAQKFNSLTKVNIPDIESEFDWELNASFSIEYWIKTNTTATMVCLGRHRLDTEHTAFWYVGTDKTTGKYAEFELRDNDGNIKDIIGKTAINDNSWHHIIAVRDGTNKMNLLYVDGGLDGGDYMNYTNNFKAVVPTEINVGYLHRLTAGEPEYHFIGDLDEIAIFNCAINESDAKSFYNEGSPTGHIHENVAPVITGQKALSLNEDHNLTILKSDFIITDPDNPNPDITIAVQPGTNYTLNGNTISPAPNFNGQLSVNVIASDLETSGIVYPAVVFVNSVNDSVQITSTPVTHVEEGTVYSYTLTVSDIDEADVIVMDAITLPAWLKFQWTAGSKTATISGTPAYANVGENPVNISISDGTISIYESFTIEVAHVAHIPVIIDQVALSINAHESLPIQKSDLTIIDLESPLSEITIEVQAGDNYTFSGNTVTPVADFSGQLSVNVIPRDLTDDGVVYPVIITVIPLPHVLTYTSTPDTTVDIGEPYIYLLTTNDENNPNLIKSVLNKPEWLDFSIEPGILSGVPEAGDEGKYRILLSISDGTITEYLQFYIYVTETTAIKEFQNNEFIIYPVPVKNELSIKFNNLSEETIINIISTTGSIVETITVPANTDIATIQTDGIEAGFYICHIKNNTINATSRFIIVK